MYKKIIVKGARVHNLKNVNVEIPRGKLVVFTGLSGSGKSSLAFDTIYAEGQRRYVESLSTYARQFLGLMDKPDVDSIEGLSPAISIDQRSASSNPRSTVGTVTEIYDYLRLLFSRIGHVHCPICDKELNQESSTQIIANIFELGKSGKEIIILAPLIEGGKNKTLEEIKKSGFKEVRVNGEIKNLEINNIEAKDFEQLEIVVGKLKYFSDKKEVFKEELSRIVELALDLGDGQLVILTEGKQYIFSQHYACTQCNMTLPDLEPRNFSFNSPAGACEKCLGLGTRLEVDADLVIPNKRLTLAEGAIKPWARNFSNQNAYWQLLSVVGKESDFSLNIAVENLSKKALDIILQGTGGKEYEVDGPPTSLGTGKKIKFPGVLAILEEKHQETTSDYLKSEIEQYMRVSVCPYCQAKRLKPVYLAVTVGNKNISEITQKTIEEGLEFFKEILKDKNSLSARDHKIADQAIKEIISRLEYLNNVGLSYVTLDRPSATLSGGEAQRIRLATQLGLSLTGVVYILDEPSIGLHQRDNQRLIDTLKHLRDLDNTVIVVEHDSMTMLAADEIIDIGPGAGENGGRIIAQGTPAEIKKNKNSLTGQYLSKALEIEAPKSYRKGNGKYIEIIGAEEFNLKNVDAKIPLGKFICITGVSGSGKSTLMLEILVKYLQAKFYRAKDLPGKHKEIKGIENIDKVIAIDQSPIGRTPRSNPATYTGVFTYIRDLFTDTQEAKIRGYKAGKFSFNAKAGRCETCAGEGLVKIEMQFLPDVYVQCEECHGNRYKHEVLEVHYQGRNIADILNMSVEQAMKFFRQQPIIYNKLKTLFEVGLGYVKLGQPATTLSGGEAQRVKLATELSRRSTGKTLYILDEPTTGLHFEDIKQLLGVLNQLVDKGNTVLIIEHNLDVIKCADWVIDMGPEGGDKGGEIVAQGTPKDIAKEKRSFTGKYLKDMLK